ncbi:hypothetical protein WR25_00467 [Diploscapter pachys]|uniref:Uncharacterized protein n=1 Tax=Diploscapter pachys TaxID=2018661 RepID=A0A2A2K424_9BILA|nr:hypothetical protein WR25_00467 [Diploscapter pachys]
MAQLPTISFVDADTKAALNSLNLRLNDIDLKLSIVLELLATRLPDQRLNSIFASPPQTVISEAASNTFTPTVGTCNSNSDKTVSPKAILYIRCDKLILPYHSIFHPKYAMR